MTTYPFARSSAAALMLATLGATACGRAAPEARAEAAAAGPASNGAATVAARPDGPGDPLRPIHVVDSIFPPAEQLRRFRAGLPRPAGLEGGSATADALARRFLAAVEHSDTADLRAMALTRAEFAYLYYPGSASARAPGREDPRIVWFLIQQNSETGIERALRKLGGRRLELRAWRCPEATQSSALRVTEGCTVTFTIDGGAPQTLRLFGSILEKDGQYKLLSYANDF